MSDTAYHKLDESNASTKPKPDFDQNKNPELKFVTNFEAYERIFEKKEELVHVAEISGKFRIISDMDLKAMLKKMVSNIENHIAVDPFWIDIQFPSSKLMGKLSKKFNIHPLTIEDCLNVDDSEGSEKNEIFDTYRFIVFHEVHRKPSTNVLNTIPINIILFKNHVITTHHGPLKSLENAVSRFSQGHIMRKDLRRPEWVLYALIDNSIDMFLSLVKQLEFEVDQLESLVLVLSTSEQTDLFSRIAAARNRSNVLRSELIFKREIIAPLTERKDENVMQEIGEAKPHHIIHSSTRVYLRDVLDHVNGMLRDIEVGRDRINSLHGTYLARISVDVAQASNRTNIVMKRFGALATIFMPLTLVAGLWGMNVHVPGQTVDNLGWWFGIVGLCGLGMIIGLITFKKLGWL